MSTDTLILGLWLVGFVALASAIVVYDRYSPDGIGDDPIGPLCGALMWPVVIGMAVVFGPWLWLLWRNHRRRP